SWSGALDVVKELSGYNDAKKCLTKGDFGACAWTVVTVASLAAGPEATAALRGLKGAAVGLKAGKDLLKFGKAARDVRRAEEAATAAKDTAKTVENVACLAAGNSFAADTGVLMADGSTKPISQVKVGDEVRATDPVTGRAAAEKVTGVITGTGEKELTSVTVATDQATGTVVATSGHPFFDDGEHRWVQAADLRPGERIQTASGQDGTVVGTSSWSRVDTVYNLTVDTLHTFFVTVAGIGLLVHNVDPDCGKNIAKQGARHAKPKTGVVAKTKNGLKAAGRKGWDYAVKRPIRGVTKDLGKALAKCIGKPGTALGIGYATEHKTLGLAAGLVLLTNCYWDMIADGGKK
ncbi:hypothetical protein FNH05_24735, partial [Amycolatopsis rhizosphaerae]